MVLALGEGVTVSLTLEESVSGALGEGELDLLPLPLVEVVAVNERVSLTEQEADELPVGDIVATEETDALPLSLSFEEIIAEEVEVQLEIGRASCRERVLMPV